MSGIILREVRSTNDKGLIGITETGEEVLLSEPKPNVAPTINLDFIVNSSNGEYFQVHPLNSQVVAFNVYKRRI